MPWPLDQFSIAVTLTPQLHLVHSRRFILPRRPWRLPRPLLSSTSVIGIGTSCVCPWLPLEASIRPSSSHDASVPPRIPGHHARPHAHPGHARGRRRPCRPAPGRGRCARRGRARRICCRRPCRRRGDRHAGRARWRSGGPPALPTTGPGVSSWTSVILSSWDSNSLLTDFCA